MIKKITRVFVWILLLNINSGFAEPNKNYIVYVSARNDDKVKIYQMNPATGSLTKLSEKIISSRPSVLTLDPKKKFLYVAQESSKKISSFKVNPHTGDLTELNSVSVLGVPTYMSTDKTGRYLLSVYWSNSKATIHEIDSTGKLGSSAVQTLNTYKNPHAVLTYGDNKYVLISCMGADTIMQFAFNSSTGKLSENPSSAFIKTVSGSGPRHFVFHHTKNIVYFVNELNGTIVAYHIDDSTKTLTAFQTISTLKAGYSGVNTSADIHITSDDRFLYASNRGPNTIAGFKIDSTTNELTLIGIYDTEKTPREFDIDPTGNFLFSAGQDAAKLASYRINQTTGALEASDVLSVGNSPSWVLAVDFDDVSTGIHLAEHNSPESFQLFPNYPNPFNPNTTISYSMQKSAEAKLTVYNALGQQIKILINGNVDAGTHTVQWDGTNSSGNKVASGVYYYMMEAEKQSKIMNMLLIK